MSSRWTRAEIATEVERLDQGVDAKLEGAADGDRAANDPSLSPRERQFGTTAAHTLREQASNMHNLAEALRDGVTPEELGYVR